MYCSSCGSMINDDQPVCANCGAPVVKPASQPAVQVQQPQPVLQSQAVPVPFKPAATSPAPAKKSKGAAIAGFVLGIFTMSLAWVIFFNILCAITGLAGTVFSILGLARKNGGLKAMAVIGLIANIIGMVYAFLTWASMWSNDIYEFLEPIANLIY